MVSRILSVPETGKKKWCGRRDLNPHGPCGPTDFLAICGFRRPAAKRPGNALAGLWSGLSLHHSRKAAGAARLVSTPSRPECSVRAWLGIAI